MTARTHDMFALASLTTAAVFYPPPSLNIPTAFAILVGNVVGSLLPDMDQASNRLWDLLPAGNAVGKIFRRLFISHRTISHSLLGFFLIYKLLEFVLPKLLNVGFVDTNLVLASVMIGVGSHLLADSLTRDGIPLFFPLSFKVGFPPLRALRIRTDTWVEHLLVLPLVIFYIVWLISENQNIFKNIFLSLAR